MQTDNLACSFRNVAVWEKVITGVNWLVTEFIIMVAKQFRNIRFSKFLLHQHLKELEASTW